MGYRLSARVGVPGLGPTLLSEILSCLKLSGVDCNGKQ